VVVVAEGFRRAGGRAATLPEVWMMTAEEALDGGLGWVRLLRLVRLGRDIAAFSFVFFVCKKY